MHKNCIMDKIDMKKTRDHYVAQAFLKRFLGSKNTLSVYNRERNTYNEVNPKNICVEKEWDTFKYLDDNLWLKNELQLIEPKLSACIDNIIQKKETFEDRVLLSKYLAILAVLTPHSLDMISKSLASTVKSIVKSQIKYDNNEILKQVSSDIFDITTNTDIFRSVVCSGSLSVATTLFKSNWIIMHNNTGHPLITSDTPLFWLPIPAHSQIFPKCIALDPQNLLFIVPYVDDKKTEESQNIFYENETGGTRHLEIYKEEVEIFNIYTIASAYRFIVLGEKNENLMQLITENSNIKSRFENTDLACTNGQYHFSTITCNRDTAQREKDYEIISNIFTKGWLR